MDWVSSFSKAINYIEDHLLEDINASDVADNVYISPFYFQKAFDIYTGYSVAEYIRSRRLYQAAIELKSTDISIIDAAIKYGYDTQESFTKAFKKFHGVTPLEAKKRYTKIKIFQPLHINISIVGGDNMDYKIEKLNGLKFIGFQKIIKSDEGYQECPKFWDEVNEKYFENNESKEISKVVKECSVGEYAICYDADGKTFKYMIGGLYDGREVPEGMTICELPESLWAKFKSFGPLPGALQSLNTMIWQEWIPNNPQYELAYNADIEWYPSDKVMDENYECAIWLPIKEK